MASYLDNIPTFNEYVEQRPQDEMLKVGLFKQQRYEEGIQKIQNSIDNIAGLDVVRPQDKEYLQSKLNALGGELSSIAASDFSNFQLVNTVDGMTKQLVNDPIILNAVGSAAKYREQLESQQKINADGKGSQSNDLFFSKQVQSWFDGGLDSSFNAIYRPYVDYSKQAQEIVKGLAADETTNDIYATTDSRGKIVYYDAITRRKIESLTPEKIQTALKAGLSPEAYQQMAIDGQFKYNGIDDRVFADDLNNSYNQTFMDIQSEIGRMEVLQSASATSEEKNAIQNQIDALQRQAESLKAEYENVSGSFANNDVETAKGQLYSTNWMKDFTNSYSYRNVSETIHTNPFRMVELQIAKMNQDAAEFNAKMMQDQMQFDETMRLKRLEVNALETMAYGGVPINQGDDASDLDVVLAGETAMNNSIAAYNAEYERIMNKYGYSKEDLAELITQNAGYPSSMQDDLRSDLATLKRLKTDSDAFTNLYTEISKEAEMLFPVPENVSNQNKSVSISYVNEDGVTENLTADYNSLNKIFNSDKFQQYVYEDFDGEFPDEISTNSYNKAMGPESDLDASEKAIFEQLFYPGYKDRGMFYEVSRDSGDPLYDEIIAYSENKVLQRALKNIMEQRNSFMADELRKTNLIPQAVAYTIPLNNTAQKEQFKGLLGGIAIDMEKGGVGEGFLKTSEASKIRSAMEDFETANVVTAGADGKYKLILQTADDQIEIDLSQQQYDKFFLGKFDASPEVQAFDSRILPSMIDTRTPLRQNSEGNYYREPNAYYTTATDNQYQTTLENAFLHSEAGDFPALRYYKASGNIVSDVNPKTENAMYRLQLNIFDPVSGQIRKNVLWPGMVPKENVAPLLNQITDQVIYELLIAPGAQMSPAQYSQLARSAQSPNATADYETFVNEDLNQDGKIGR